MPDPQMVMETLERYGHTATTDRDKVNARNIGPTDIANGKLTLEDKEIKEAIQSYQQWFEPRLNELALQFHGREAIADGEIGPAFAQLLTEPRCGCPEFHRKPNEISQHNQNPDPLFSRAEANWPKTCRNKLKINKSFKKLPGLTEEDTTRVWIAVANITTHSYIDMTCKYRPDLVDPLQLDVYSRLKRLPGSTLAWNYLATNRCDVTLDAAYDSLTNWSLQMAVATASHEHHHGWGHNHVRDPQALMYPSINRASRERWGFPNNTDMIQANRLGYSVDYHTKSLEPNDLELFNPDPGNPDVPRPPRPPGEPSPSPDSPGSPSPQYNPFQGVKLIHPNGKTYIIVPEIRIALSTNISK